MAYSLRSACYVAYVVGPALITDTLYIKVGITQNFKHRFSQYTTTAPFIQWNIYGVWYIADTKMMALAFETEFHRRWRQYRVKTTHEWLCITPELHLAICNELTHKYHRIEIPDYWKPASWIRVHRRQRTKRVAQTPIQRAYVAEPTDIPFNREQRYTQVQNLVYQGRTLKEIQSQEFQEGLQSLVPQLTTPPTKVIAPKLHQCST